MARGILLAGGAGTRLYPATLFTSKQFLPVYDKPMAYYPLSTLLSAGIRDVLVITQSCNLQAWSKVVPGEGPLGVRFSFASQDEPRGIAEALVIAEGCGFWDGQEPIALILGDNIFDEGSLSPLLRQAFCRAAEEGSATIFTAQVARPERYGVVEPGENGELSRIVEKPEQAPSNWAVTGLYVYPAGAQKIAANVGFSARGEMEITDVNNEYLQRGKLHWTKLPAEIVWFDAGMPEDLLAASQYVAAVQSRQGRLVGSPELAAVRGGLSDGRYLRLYSEASYDYLQRVSQCLDLF